jgi:hypothetical protein
VRQGVATEVAIAPKHLATGTTLVGLVVGVGEQVGLEVGALVETAAAHRTLVGGLLHVQDLVHGQSPRLAEPLATLSALERLLLRMDVPATDIHSLMRTSPDFVLPQKTNSKTHLKFCRSVLMHQSNSNLTGKSAGVLSHQITTSLQRYQVPSCLTRHILASPLTLTALSPLPLTLN